MQGMSVDDSSEGNPLPLPPSSLDQEIFIHGEKNPFSKRCAIQHVRVLQLMGTVLVGSEDINLSPSEPSDDRWWDIVIEV